MIHKVFGVGSVVGLAVYIWGQSLPLQFTQTEEQVATVIGGACYVDATSLILDKSNFQNLGILPSMIPSSGLLAQLAEQATLNR